MILEHGAGSLSLAYHRVLRDGRVLTVARHDGGDGGLCDDETGSHWSPSGLAIEGALSGVQLSFVTSFVSGWDGRAAFNPETSIYPATESGNPSQATESGNRVTQPESRNPSQATESRNPSEATDREALTGQR